MTSIGGLPAHILLVHLVVVLLPATSLAAILASLWPAAQRKLTFLVPLGAIAGLIAVPLTTHAGMALDARLHLGPVIARHEQLGSMVLPWVIALAVTTTGQWAYLRFAPRRAWATLLIAALVTAASIGTIILVVLTGDAGSRVVWGGVFGGPPG